MKVWADGKTIELPTNDGTLMIDLDRVIHFGLFGDTSLVQRHGQTVVMATTPPLCGPVILHEHPEDPEKWSASCQHCFEESPWTAPRDNVIHQEWAKTHRCQRAQ